MMKRFLRVALVAGLSLTGIGCSDFLTGDKLDEDPNTASSATSLQLFSAIQANSFSLHNGHLVRVLAMWTQQMAGTDRQYIGFDLYSIFEDTFDGEFIDSYTNAGLIGVRQIQAQVGGDKTFLGIAKVWEAFYMTFVADMWGAAPYTEAASDVATPKLDTQAEIYARLQTLLDGAIADLQANQGAGPGSVDLIYGGDRAKWIAAARTLKARLYLHTAEVTNGNYALALTQAQQGIGSKAGDWKTFQSSGTGEENPWYQFFINRDSYTRGGKFFVDLLVSRSDPRLTEYFGENEEGGYGGAAPGEQLKNHHSWLSATRGSASFRQPIVTWAENQLIISEMQYRGGNAAAARTALNAVRTDAGLPVVDAALAGTALLTSILEEKYIVLFQNSEAYNDYKRTCFPNIAPASNAYNGNIPPRVFYGTSEGTTNPNIPAVNAQPRRNANDPVNATAPDGSACRGQKS